MKTNLIKILFVGLLSSSIFSCGGNKNSGGTTHPDIPPIIEDDDPIKEDDDPIKDDDDPINEDDDHLENYLEISDYPAYFYIGESFDYTNRMKVTLHLDGVTKDSSFKLDYNVKAVIKDENGNEIDGSKPFTKEGNYNVQLIYLPDESVISKVINFVVKESPTNILEQKEILPSGFTYKDINNSMLSDLSFPDKGDVNVLVIPLEISDFPFQDSVLGENYLDKINTLFNGKGVEDTGYWESITSYYEKSSLNNLHFNFDIAETYQCGYETKDLLSGGISNAFVLTSMAVDNYISNHGEGSTSKYDNDGDGYIDGIWIIYSAPDYSSYDYSSKGSDLFWAFCSDISGYMPNKTTPTVHSFGWASISFMNEGVDAPNIDSHTFIHETGHLLGLPDYYSYDYTGATSSGAQGGLAMMDLNIGDMDSFSKLALGWANPYVVKEDCVVKIKPNSSSGDSIILADSWNGTAFDEYILLDFVTPEGINELDSKNKYINRPSYFTTPGVRAFHVDARLGEFKYVYCSDGYTQEGLTAIEDSETESFYMSDESVKKLVSKGTVGTIENNRQKEISERGSGYGVINSNSPSRCMIENKDYTSQKLLSIISKDGKISEVDDVYANDNFLFQEGDSWTINCKSVRNFSSSFGNLNNGNMLRYSFSVLSIDETGATIQFKKY